METQKEMIARLIRYLLLFVSGWLVTRGIIPQEFADTWLNETTTLIAGVILVSIPVVWGYLKAKFDARVVEAAVQLPRADTPSEIQAKVEQARGIAAHKEL